jgi:hypothetical protein
MFRPTFEAIIRLCKLAFGVLYMKSRLSIVMMSSHSSYIRLVNLLG